MAKRLRGTFALTCGTVAQQLEYIRQFRLSIGASKLDDLIRVKAIRVVDLRTTPAKQRAEIRVRHVDLERFLRGLPEYAPRSAKFISRGALTA